MRQKVVARGLVAIGALVFAFAIPLPLAGSLGETCAEAAAGPSVAMVVDFGDVGGVHPFGVVTRCVPIGDRTTGAQALIAAGFELRLGPGGMVCAINGYPATGCGEQTGGRQYLYWSYWRADASTSGWDYSSIGPGGARVADGDIEGWRFVDGSGRPSDPQPGHAPDHVAICGPPRLEGPSAPAPSDNDAAPMDDAGVQKNRAPGASAAAPSTALDPQAGAVEPADSTTTSTSPSAGSDGSDAVALDDAVPASTTSGGGGAAAVVVVLLIAALGGAAWLRSRRRPRAE